MDIGTFLQDLYRANTFPRLALNAFTQFGNTGQPYLGATLLPERLVPANDYTEAGVRYRTSIANDGTRYSPAQKKGSGVLQGSVKVSLGNNDIAREFTGQDLDAVIQILTPLTGIQVPAGMQAAATVAGWSNVALNLGMIEKNEQQRWQAICYGTVTRKGDNGYEEIVEFPKPAGHRVAAGGNWTDPEYPILDDLLSRRLMLARKGYTVNRMITSTAVQGVMLANKSMARAAGKAIITVAPGGTLTQTTQAFTADDLNALLRANQLPQVEVYDRTYFMDDNTSARFMPEDVVVFAATTGQNENVFNINNPAAFQIIPNTVGYTAVGRAVGQTGPGRVLQLTYYGNKPPRIEGEGWQTSFPVITQPEAFAVINSITLPG